MSSSQSSVPAPSVACRATARRLTGFRVARGVAWLFASAVAAISVGWSAFDLQQYYEFGPLGIMPLLTGTCVGAAVVALAAWRVPTVRMATLLFVAAAMALTSVAAQSQRAYHLYRDNYEAIKRKEPKVAMAEAMHPSMGPRSRGQFMADCMRERPLIWVLDLLCTPAASLAVAGLFRLRLDPSGDAR